MSEPIEPQYDAPTCTQTDCEGPLKPSLYADGRALRPSDANVGSGLLLSGWDVLTCAACGHEQLSSPVAMQQAWYSVGAYEQRRAMEKTVAIPC